MKETGVTWTKEIIFQPRHMQGDAHWTTRPMYQGLCAGMGNYQSCLEKNQGVRSRRDLQFFWRRIE